MDATITQRLYDLESALKRSQGLEKALEDIKRWLEEKEDALKTKDALSIKRDELQDLLSKYSVSNSSLNWSVYCASLSGLVHDVTVIVSDVTLIRR